MGARVVAQYAVLGPYDFVTIMEAPDNATISRVSVELGARGGVAGMTMAAIPLDEFIERLERGASRADGKKKRAMKVLKLHPERCTGCLRCEIACSYMQTGDVPAGQVRHPRLAVRGPHLLRALHVHAVRRGLVHDGLPGGRHHHQRGRRQGRGRRQVRGLQALHDRLPVRDDVLRHRPRARPSSATSAAATRPAPTPARRRRSSTRRRTTADWIGDFARERVSHVLALEGAR